MTTLGSNQEAGRAASDVEEHMGWIQKLEGPRGVRHKAGYRDPFRRPRYRTFSRRRDADAYLSAPCD